MEWKDEHEPAKMSKRIHMWLGVAGAQGPRKGMVLRGNYEGFPMAG